MAVAVFGLAELRSRVLSFINDPKDVRQLERVNKCFLQSLSDTYWSNARKLSVVAPAYGLFNSVNGMDGFATFGAIITAIKWILKRAMHLDTVQLSCLGKLEEDAQSANQLDTILALVAENASSLKHLSFGNNYVYRWKLVSSIVHRNAATLRSVNFEGNCRRSEGEWISPSEREAGFIPGRLIQQCTSLCHVRLAALYVDYSGYPLLGALKALPSLDTVELHLDCFALHQIFSCFDGLAIRSLIVAWHYDLASALMPIQVVVGLPQLRKLRLIDYRDAGYNLDTHDLCALLNGHCPRLNWLRVELNLRNMSHADTDAPQFPSLCRFMVNWLQKGSASGDKPSLLRVELGRCPDFCGWIGIARTLADHFEAVRVMVADGVPRATITCQDASRRLATFHYNEHTIELTCDNVE